MLKLLRRFEKFLLLQHAFLEAAEALPVLLYMLATICLTFSCLIYLVEPRSNIATLPEAMWLTIVTMMTVGYGDTVPKSAIGFCVVTVLVVCSVLFMAMPLGIIGATFNNVWTQRDCILLVKRMRDQMDQRGYAAVDIPYVFRLFDSDYDGELSMGDFIRMLESLGITLPPERIIELFDTFDADGGGSIDAIEFIRQVFPTQYAELHADDMGGEEGEEDDMGGEEGEEDEAQEAASLEAAVIEELRATESMETAAEVRVGSQVVYQGWHGCMIAKLNDDGTADIEIPGMEIERNIPRADYQQQELQFPSSDAE